MFLGASCASVGPKTIPRDQFDYGNSIAGSAREQILANIVGLRYVEAPVFVNVSSVINQYGLEGEVALNAGANTSITGSNTVGVGGASRWSDRPTITYTPISGQEFAASLLTPIPPEALFALVQGGWPAHVLLRLAVRSINGVENEWAGPSTRRQADPLFYDVLAAWSRLRNARVLALRRSAEEEGAHIVLYLNEERRRMSPQARQDAEFLFDALELEPGANDIRMTYGLIPESSKDMAVLTSSILELMNELAWRMDVPPKHIEEGRTTSTFVADDPELVPLVKIHYAKERPDTAFVAVHNRDYWFYIDDRDTFSKRTFALVQIMLSLTDSGDAARGPVVSIGQ
jgi:hypothetical protein